MSGLVKVHVRLSPHQMDKLHKGQTVQLRHAQLNVEDAHHLMVHPHIASKIHRAHRARKGVRISLSQPEIEETIGGGGFGDFFNKLKSAGQWLKKNVVDSDFYQSNIKPLARQAVDAGLSMVTPRLGVAAPAAKAAVDEIGKRTGAFGLVKRKHMTKATVQAAPVEHDAMKDFYVESSLMPRPGGPAGFTALPQGSYGDGVSSHHVHHHHYYAFPHHKNMKGGMRAGSFRLA